MKITAVGLQRLLEIVKEAENSASILMGSKLELKIVAPGLGSFTKENMTTISQALLKEFILLVAESSEMTYEELIGPCREDHVKYARHAIAYIAKENFKILTLELIGEELGGRSHTTIINCINVAQDFIDTNDSLFMPIYYKAQIAYSKSKINN